MKEQALRGDPIRRVSWRRRRSRLPWMYVVYHVRVQESVTPRRGRRAAHSAAPRGDTGRTTAKAPEAVAPGAVERSVLVLTPEECRYVER